MIRQQRDFELAPIPIMLLRLLLHHLAANIIAESTMKSLQSPSIDDATTFKVDSAHDSLKISGP